MKFPTQSTVFPQPLVKTCCNQWQIQHSGRIAPWIDKPSGRIQAEMHAKKGSCKTCTASPALCTCWFFLAIERRLTLRRQARRPH